MHGILTLDELRPMIEAGTIDTVLTVFPDLQGRLMGKRNTGHFFLEHAAEAVHACDYLLATDMEMETVPGYQTASWDQGYGDFTLKVDLGTLRRATWLPGTAIVLGDIVDHHGEMMPHAPRTVLKHQLARLAEKGWTAKMASELEFYVFNETYESARDKHYQGLETAGRYIQDYHILQTTKEEELLRAIRNHLDQSGVPVESSKGEWGPGQEELNLVYAEALEMADRHVLFKHAAKEIALLQNKAVTFMAKWRTDLAGSSCHIHASLWEGETPLFFEDGRKHGMSKLFESFLAGQLELAPALTVFLAPFVNSYKRFQAASFAPTKAVWSMDNRTAGFRVLTGGTGTRVECRVPGADANPYLAYAALLAAGLHGIENNLTLGEPFSGNAYDSKDTPEVPKTLREAIELLDGCQPLRGAMGDVVIDHYVHTARWEQSQFDREVTDWELRRNFERC